MSWCIPNRRANFNPRPPRGGRPFRVRTVPHTRNFNPRPPRGGRPKQQNYFIPRQVFQSTPSARRATLSSAAKPRRASNFNPRPPRGGRRTAAGPRGRAAKNFNPRPPRGGRPVPSGICVPGVPVFQSTPSARRATALFCLEFVAIINFNPRPPRGGRLSGPW